MKIFGYLSYSTIKICYLVNKFHITINHYKVNTYFEGAFKSLVHHDYNG